MLVLLVNDGHQKRAFYENLLAPFTTPEAIMEVKSISAAKIFLQEHLIERGKHLDLIFTNYQFPQSRETGRDLFIWLKSKEEATYFDSNFLLKALPVVIAHTFLTDMSDDFSLGFNAVISSPELLQAGLRAKTSIAGVAKSWTEKVIEDFDLLKIDPRKPTRFGKVFYNTNCKVLTRRFALSPFVLPQLSFQRDIDEAEAAIDHFIKEVEKISRSAKPRQEKEYHQLLLRHPAFLLGHAFDKYFYEKNFKLRPTSNDNYEPDFILRHHYHDFNKSGKVVEVKLPNDKFIVRKDFHPKLSSDLMGHLAQVSDYEEYFKERLNWPEIKFRLGYVPKLEHSILLGRDAERDAHLELIEKRLRRMNLDNIVLITYDELARNREQMLEQNKWYRTH